MSLDMQAKLPITDLAGEQEGLISSDNKGVIGTKSIPEITTAVVTEAVPKGVKENEVIAVKNGSFVGTGIIGKNGDGQFAAGTVSVGLHDISSGGENVVTVNSATGKKYAPVWQEIAKGTKRKAAIRVNDDTLRTNEFQTDISTNITNPSYSLTLSDNVTIFEAEYTAATAQTNVHFNLKEQGAAKDTWRSKPRDLKAGLNVYDLHVPLDLKANVEYILSAYSDDGDVILKGNSSNIPYFKFKYQTYTDKEVLPTDDSMADTGHNWTGSKINSEISQVKDIIQTTSQVLQSDIAQKINGLHVEDVDNNSFDNIKALHFDGAEVSDDGGDQVTVTVHPKFAVSNGQSIGSDSYEVSNLEFPGATLTTKDDGKIAVVDIGNNPQVEQNKNDINTIKVILSEEEMVYSYIGSTAPALPTSYRGEYYLRFESLAGDITTELPNFSHNENGTKYGVVNTDSTHSVLIKAPTGYQIANEDSYTVPPRSSVYLIKKSDTRWVIGLSNEAASGGAAGITVDNGSVSVGGVKQLQLPTSEIVDQSGGSVVIMPQMIMSNMGDSSKDTKANTITVQAPLETFADPGVTGGAKLYIKPDAYEAQKPPGYLAFIKDETDVIGDRNDPTLHDGLIWFDDVAVGADSPYISTDRANKQIRIEEADNLDPNITGGTDYLIAAKIHLHGKAPDNGVVQVYLTKRENGIGKPTYLLDVNGDPIVVEKQYKADEDLGYLVAMGIVKAKEQIGISVHVEDNFDDILELDDRTQGGSCFMIQALGKDYKTGDSLQEFELSTGLRVNFSKHYLGSDRMNIALVTRDNTPVISYTAGTNFYLADGIRLINPNGLKGGTQNNQLVIQDDGSNICDFNFGKIFSAEETKMLRSKVVNFSATLVDKDNAYYVALVEWTGKPDEYTRDIFTTRTNGEPVFNTGWVKEQQFFISKDAVSGDHEVSNAFTIPDDANNYAIIMYPAGAQSPMTLKLKKFNVDVATPFIGYVLHGLEDVAEEHLRFDTEYKKLVQNTQGYASLRYTINTVNLPMPVGELGKGLADVSIDPDINKIPGSQAKGGEGAIVFDTSGTVSISTELRLWSEKSASTTTAVKFWYSKVGPGNALTKIVDSEGIFNIKGGSKNIICSMPTFNIDVLAGEKIVLSAQSNLEDGAFLQCTSDLKPMLSTTIEFKELVDSGDDPFSGLDLSQFNAVHNGQLTAVKIVQNAASANIPLTVPADMDVVVLDAVKYNADGSIRKVKNLDYSYKDNMLSVSFGETVTEVKIIIGVYI